jgi:hypothetical protein
MDPVTGSKGYSNVAREYSGTTELNTLGSDITYPPPPPNSQIFEPPVFIEPVKQTYYQVEGGPSYSYGIDSWYTNVVNQNFDRQMAETYWRHGFRDWAMAIVANNPNLGVQSQHYDQNGNYRSTSFRWGAQAAGFLMGISSDIESGRLIDVTNSYTEVLGYELQSPSKVPLALPADLRDRVAKIVNKSDTDCRDYIKKLIARVSQTNKAYSDNPLDLFDRVQREGGFHLKNMSAKDAGKAGFTGGKRVVYIRPVFSYGDTRLDEHSITRTISSTTELCLLSIRAVRADRTVRADGMCPKTS